jgi:hypothetical protein
MNTFSVDNIPMDIDIEDTIHFFLWASHGNTVSPLATSSEIYHTKIPRFVYYAKHGEPQYPGNLQPYNLLAMQKPPNNAPLSNFPSNFSHFYNGVDIRKNIRGNISIPPLIFSLDSDPLSEVAAYTGLYYFKLNKYFDSVIQSEQYRLIEYDRIFVHNDLLQIYGDKLITLSKIEKHVLDYCKKKNISDLNTVNIGFFTCKIVLDRYINEYSELPLDIHEETIQPANIINFEEVGEPIQCSILRIFVTDSWIFKEDWQALAGLMHQGCALNVLSFYDLMSQPKARQRAVCLTLKGTSIFRIIDYINNYLKMVYETPINFFVCRFPIIAGLLLINSFLNSYKSANSYVIIFKIYRDNLNPTKTSEYSEIGHTISVVFNSYTGTNWIIDPQTQYFEQMNTEKMNIENNNELYQRIINKYGNNFNYIDVIFVARTANDVPFSVEPTRPIYTGEDIRADVSNGLVSLRNRPTNVPYGGILSKKSKRTKRTKRSKKTKTSRRTKKSKRTKKNKTHKSTKKYKY